MEIESSTISENNKNNNNNNEEGLFRLQEIRILHKFEFLAPRSDQIDFFFGVHSWRA